MARDTSKSPSPVTGNNVRVARIGAAHGVRGEMKLWRASEADVRDALTKDIEKKGEASRFVRLADDEFTLRSWAVE